jgi:hypothetical protein
MSATHRFTFGREVRPVPTLGEGRRPVFVLGVYQSAVHARWADPDGKKWRALAVAMSRNLSGRAMMRSNGFVKSLRMSRPRLAVSNPQAPSTTAAVGGSLTRCTSASSAPAAPTEMPAGSPTSIRRISLMRASWPASEAATTGGWRGGVVPPANVPARKGPFRTLP